MSLSNLSFRQPIARNVDVGSDRNGDGQRDGHRCVPTGVYPGMYREGCIARHVPREEYSAQSYQLSLLKTRKEHSAQSYQLSLKEEKEHSAQSYQLSLKGGDSVQSYQLPLLKVFPAPAVKGVSCSRC